jgi:hypothetical protein
VDAPQGVDVNELDIRRLASLSEEDFLHLVTGCTSLTRYAVQKTESLEHTTNHDAVDGEVAIFMKRKL